jgi:hypothetical protein
MNMNFSSIKSFCKNIRISPQNILIQSFSKYVSNSRAKRIPLNTKRAGKGYNKGYGARKEGRVDSLGIFIHPYCYILTESSLTSLTYQIHI